MISLNRRKTGRSGLRPERNKVKEAKGVYLENKGPIGEPDKRETRVKRNKRRNRLLNTTGRRRRPEAKVETTSSKSTVGVSRRGGEDGSTRKRTFRMGVPSRSQARTDGRTTSGAFRLAGPATTRKFHNNFYYKVENSLRNSNLVFDLLGGPEILVETYTD